MGKRVTVFAGYDSRSYDLIRKLRLYDGMIAVINVVHVPVSDNDNLAGLVIPSIVVEDKVNDVIRRYVIYSLSELSLYTITAEVFNNVDGYVKSSSYGG